MDKEARAATIRIIKSHLVSVESDLMSHRDRLDEVGCKREARMLDGVCEKLYRTLCSLKRRE